MSILVRRTSAVFGVLRPSLGPAVQRIALVLLLASVSSVVTPARSLFAQSDSARSALFRSIDWTPGPTTGQLGSMGKVAVPEGCSFSDAAGAKTFMEATENPPTGQEQGVVLCRGGSESDPTSWFVIYEFNATGYVKDDEKASLDKDKIYASLDEGTREGNEERRSRGWSEIEMGGWVRAPYYDERTHNLTWALRVLSEGDTSVNHSVRLLGRRGVLKADLVIDPSDFETALSTFDAMIAGTEFLPGNTYAEWREGDKVAKYGLTALVAGGAGAAAMKLGLFGKLWKLIATFFAAAGKLIIVAVVGIGAWVRKLFRRQSGDAATAPPGGAA
jgi:uncharacterized membrane-anchored protein